MSALSVLPLVPDRTRGSVSGYSVKVFAPCRGGGSVWEWNDITIFPCAISESSS